MSTNQHPFTFDINFRMGDESLLSDMNYQGPADAPIPPVEGFFLFLDLQIFGLADGDNLILE